MLAQIQVALNPTFLDVEDESHRHHVPKDAQTHFKVTVVSHDFEGMSLIKRHRLINELMKAEFETGLHALAIHAYTPTQWFTKNQRSPASPNCLDGFKHSKEDQL